MIDERLKASKDLETDVNFEVLLKLHICGAAAREFQKMHDHFIQVNDPRRCLDLYKDKYCSDFKDLFNERDQCQTKAEEFTCLCLRPALEESVAHSLGPDIVDEMLTGENALQFSTRAFFQYSILKHLLSEFNFENYDSYICSYEKFVKNWIFGQIKERFSKGQKMFQLEDKHLKAINICRELGDTLVIPKDALSAFMILNNAEQEQFAHCLKTSVEEMEKSLRIKFQEGVDAQRKLEQLRIKPQNVLFKRVFGCGKQCPFCKAPCEAGGEAHTDHCASIHRPQVSKNSICYETNQTYHPYKKYRDIFPNWHIPADPSIEASDYWKYVMAKFNKEFAKKYDALPAITPPAWKLITKEQAEKSLKESFSIN
ncbi:unnamed protein product [Coregonus sp. 'balchen']|nr:unnamed protein product [Coregonus sp. 'balchen']